MQYTAFSAAIIEALGYYVYYLRDPRTNKIFYIGKGTHNRIFNHLAEALDASERQSAKLDQIRDITNAGLSVQYAIHRHGLTEKEAFEVESALIDFVGLGDLTNIVSGHHSRNRGPMSIEEVFIAYDAQKVMIEEPGIVLNIRQLFYRGMSPEEIYEATRGNWKVGDKKRQLAQYAYAVFHGIIREVYRIEEWSSVQVGRNGERYSRIRWRFSGSVATEIREKYLHKDASDYVGQNPVRYVNV
jgi:uncharacterized protein